MKWNENPFARNTRVSIFSNGTEAESWCACNCDCCIRKNKCNLESAILSGWAGDGRIPLWVAKEIGCNYDPLYQQAQLSNQCRAFTTGDEPF